MGPTTWKDVIWIAVVMLVASFTVCYVATLVVNHPPVVEKP